jgi:hypothetical protein
MDGDTEYEINAWAVHNNAEISMFARNNEQFKALMEAQHDNPESYSSRWREKESLRNLTIIPIQGTGIVKNIRYGLPPNCKLHIRDVKHISGAGKQSANDMAKAVGLGGKVGGIDFKQHDAFWYMEHELDTFIEYGLKDALIPVLFANMFTDAREAIFRGMRGTVIEPDAGFPTGIDKFLSKPPITVSSNSAFLAKSHLEFNGVDAEYRKSIKYLEANCSRELLERKKGGLNKNYMSDRPGFYNNVDVWDVTSAYLNAVGAVSFPLWNPIHNAGWFNPEKTISAKQLAKQINGYHTAYVRLEWELPENSTEHERCLVAYINGLGATTRKAEIPQWITMFEVQTLATVCPKAKVRVLQILAWEHKGHGKVASLKALTDYLYKARREAKEVEPDGAVQEFLKLFGNGLVGKLAQEKEVLEPMMVHDAIQNGGQLSGIINTTSKSTITHPLFFNLVTGAVRSLVSLMAWKNKALMTVTDSLVIPHGAFIHNKDVVTGFKHLDVILQIFDWKLEHENVDILIAKERDYAIVEIKPSSTVEVREEINANIRNGIMLDAELLEQIDICKVAKRGFKSPKHLEATEKKQQFLNKKIQGIKGDFPVKNDGERLSTFKLMLMGKYPLNTEYSYDTVMGSHNKRYNCDSLTELVHRDKLDKRAKSRGFADLLHCQLTDPESYRHIIKTPTVKPHITKTIPCEIKRLIAIASKFEGVSCRELATITQISKSTINQLVRKFSSTNIDGIVYKQDCKTVNDIRKGTSPLKKTATEQIEEYFKIYPIKRNVPLAS